MLKANWIKDLVRAEEHLEETGVVDLSLGLDSERVLTQEAINLLSQLKEEFIEVSNAFNDLKASPLGRIKIYGIAKTQADFMLFRNGFKMIFYFKAPGVIAIRHHFLGATYNPPNIPSSGAATGFGGGLGGGVGFSTMPGFGTGRASSSAAGATAGGSISSGSAAGGAGASGIGAASISAGGFGVGASTVTNSMRSNLGMSAGQSRAGDTVPAIEEVVIEARKGPFHDLVWCFNGEAVKMDALVRYHFTLFVKESSK